MLQDKEKALRNQWEVLRCLNIESLTEDKKRLVETWKKPRDFYVVSIIARHSNFEEYRRFVETSEIPLIQLTAHEMQVLNGGLLAPPEEQGVSPDWRHTSYLAYDLVRVYMSDSIYLPQDC